VFSAIWGKREFIQSIWMLASINITVDEMHECITLWGISLTEYMCRIWNSYMHMTVIRI